MPDSTKQVTDDSANTSPADPIGMWLGDLIRLHHELEHAATQLRMALGR